ncbi:MAG: hypothetical protein I8H77_15145 [Comamonadaceae bacterium]|nr:hypothetical protein [Comamonadaceae bacterium]
MTSPAMRDMFMAPHNPPRAKNALLSWLNNDICGSTTIWTSCAVLKGTYHASLLASLLSAIRAWRRRILIPTT